MSQQTRLEGTPMRDHTSGRARRGAAIVATLAVAAVVGVSLAASADGAANHRVKLDSTIFAAQVGSLIAGGSVYAGALPDQELGQGAIIFTTKGRPTVRVSFQEFFALGSIKGTGSVTL